MTPFHKKIKGMTLFDIHTHNNNADGVTAIFNSTTYVGNRNISIGIHPWRITDNWEVDFADIAQEAQKENIVAIGECGIDKSNSTADIEEQLTIFKAHALLAEKVKKPLIIHCVKGFDEIIAIKKEITPQQAWIIHGFRGKPQQAEQLIKAGFYISFGEKFNNDTLKTIPLDRLFIESDESKTTIDDIYSLIAKTKGCAIEELASHIMQNAENCNIRL